MWVCSTRPDGRPHAMPVWALWIDGALWFSTDPSSYKARNLARSPEGVQDAVLRIVRYPEPQTVELMISHLDGVVGRMREMEREVYRSAREPTPVEAAGGAEPIEGLDRAILRWIDRRLPS